ncbi:MAG: ABC transporter substrate-binding protein [Thermodesulfobacteriota bacterium]
MNKKSVFPLIILFLVLLWVFSTTRVIQAGDTTGVTDDTIALGHILDYTGPAAETTLQISKAIEAYFRDFNERGGVNGRKIEFLKEDDRYSIPGAIAAFKKLVFKDKVFVCLSVGGTGQTLALSEQIAKNKIPCIVISKSRVMTEPLKKYIFTGGPSHDDITAVLIDYIVKDLRAKSPKVAIGYPDVSYGKEVLDGLTKRLKHHGLEPVAIEVIPIGAVDASSQALNVKKKGAEYAIMIGTPVMSIAFMKFSNVYGYKPVHIGYYYNCSETIPKALGKIAEGFLGVHAFVSWDNDVPGMIKAKKISLKYYPGWKATDIGFAEGIVNSILTEDALRRAGRDLSREKFIEALESTKNLEVGGIGAPLTITPTNHKASDSAIIFKADLKEKIMVPVGGWRKPLP